MRAVRLATRAGDELTLEPPALERFGRHLAGPLLTADDPRYDGARRLWNGLIDRRPGLIVRCRSPEDVGAAVAFAREHDLLTAIRGGGHNVAGRATVDGGLVIDLGEMRAVHLEHAGGRRVRALGGATIGDVDGATAAAGLAVPLGVVSATGVAGLTLHGGYGWFVRRHGLSADNLLAAEVVTADGKGQRASADENPDLFWALRGGGGNFGVVTALEYQAHPVPDPLSFVAVFYPAAQAETVLRTFRDYMRDAPDELTALAVLWSVPPEPPFPPGPAPIPVAIVVGCYSGPPALADRVTRPLRDIGQPLADLSGPRSLLGVQQFFDPDYPNGRLYYWKSSYLDGLKDEAIVALERQAASRVSPLSSLDVWGLGGALTRVDAAATAFAQRDARFMLAIESNWNEPAATDANLAWTRQAHRALAPHLRPEAYLNFPGFGEDGEAQVRAAYGGNYERLRAVKRTYDPDNFFRVNFNIAP